MKNFESVDIPRWWAISAMQYLSLIGREMEHGWYFLWKKLIAETPDFSSGKYDWIFCF